jgi:ABC transport system ATP-binding/permease protein
MLARGLVDDPDLLLLDEPTNHLDIQSIAWLEEHLSAFPGALIFVTHDRTLLRRLATRIIELDRGRLTAWNCDYDSCLFRKEALAAAEAMREAAFDKKLAQEEAWLRQGIKARRTRNEGRVRALLQLRRERQERRPATGEAMMEVTQADLSGVKVIEAENVSFGYNGQKVISDFSTLITRGDKIGIVGPNGAGKSTLLRLLLGKLPPDQGSVSLGTKLEPAYFDQLREQLDPDKTVAENVADGNTTVTVGGQDRHVMSYLRDFLFTPDRVRSPVGSLSGGERNRLLLARLFARPANLLVLDEPTNDLDMETLELLEDLLVDYKGTLLLVSHDRAFLDNVATSLLVFEGEGRLQEYIGGFDDYLRQRPQSPPAPPEPAAARQPPAKKKKPRRFTNTERRELEALPARIEELEKQQADLAEQLGDPELYQQGGGKAAAIQAHLTQLGTETAEAYRRWEELENLREQLEESETK